MYSEILEQEKTHLADVKSKLIDSKSTIEDALEKIGAGTLDRLQELREGSQSADFELMLSQLHNTNEALNIPDKYKRLDEISLLLKQPFFARIDLKDEQSDAKNELYIGKFGFTYDKPEIIDWRAKVASVYYRYRYPQKGVKYDTPDGQEVKDLTLKRTYEIDNGELLKYFNNDLQLDETQIISEKIEKRTGGVLEDIIETIQEGQLDIIESDPRRVTIVQGAVGSGKSTVAIHKLSHIFFNFPEIVTPERSILIAKNQILVGYLSTLFPKLGIFDIKYKSLRELLVNVLFREKLKVQVDLDADTDASVISINDIDSIKTAAGKVAIKTQKAIDTLFLIPEFQSFSGFKYSFAQTPYENISDVLAELDEELQMQKEELKEKPEGLRAMLVKENIKNLKKITARLKKLQSGLDEVDFYNVLKQFKVDHKSKLSYVQTLIYALIYTEIIGLKSFLKYEYCVVDEGQDFSVLEYAVLGKLVINGRFTILGDLNQAYTEQGLAAWEDIEQVIVNKSDAQVFELDTNYRSTKPIIELANTVLGPYSQKYLPKSINRQGSDPILNSVESFEELFAKDMQNLDKSIGIICMNAQEYERARVEISKYKFDKYPFIELDAKEKIVYHPKAVYLMHFDDCKGLEFSKVYVLGLDLGKISTHKQAKTGFVAITRAMNELVIFS